MRLCRYEHHSQLEIAVYREDSILPINRAAEAMKIRLPAPSNQVLDYLAPGGRNVQALAQLDAEFRNLSIAEQQRLLLPITEVQLRVPLAEPKKVILLAGNYAAHIVEGGGQAVERAETFPYFFWKPPGTTLTDPGAPIVIPRVSPDHVDWEIELGVVIGRQARHVAEKEALSFVAGYTVCNDVSDRRFQINPDRKAREKDRFFDWLHGKWHNTFLPCGPCIRSAASLPDPQRLRLALRVNGATMQDASTAQMIFPVAALVSILSDFTTLEPGDLLVTGTPAGVGHARKPPIYLKPGDQVECEIEGIGVLRNLVEAEK